MTAPFTVAGLFAGVGGIEAGLHRAGGETVLLAENWAPAQSVLKERYPQADLVGDISTELRQLPRCDVVTAGFPCTDLSQAGRTAGLNGSASGLVLRALELIQAGRPSWVLLENVPNMLHLSGGHAIAEITARLEGMGYAWAYRIVDSRSFGVAQRRRRVFVLASSTGDPASVLLGQDAGEPPASLWRTNAYGFYWTEGNRGIGWARDAVPTLKGSTTASIPSPPGIWLPTEMLGHRVVRPSIETAEVLQGLPPGWTEAAPRRDRWKLVGNAVTAPVAEWIGRRLQSEPADVSDCLDRVPLGTGQRWPGAAYSRDGKRWAVTMSEWPVRTRYRHLAKVLEKHGFEPLSRRATAGFRSRLQRSSLRYQESFFRDLVDHETAVQRA